MSKIEICLSTIIGNEYLTVLDRVHGSRINVDIWVKLLHSDFVATSLQQTSKRCGGDSFSETGNNTTSDKDVFNRHNYPPQICKILSDTNNLHIIQPRIKIFHTFLEKV